MDDVQNSDEEICELPQPISASDLLRTKNQAMTTLFSLYEQKRCLWDKSDDDYANRSMREDAWASIFEYYRRVVINPDEKRMRTMFTNVRSCWRREFKKDVPPKEPPHNPDEFAPAKLMQMFNNVEVTIVENDVRNFSFLTRLVYVEDPKRSSGGKINVANQNSDRNVKASMMNGEADAVYKPTLWYYDALNFVADDGVDREGADMEENDVKSISSAAYEMYYVQNSDEEICESSPQPISATDLLRAENQAMTTLFSLYEQNRCLWDKNDDDYANRSMREDAWASIFEYYRTVVINPDEKRMRTMFTNVRSCWRREFKKVKASMMNGEADAVYKPTLWYYDALNFLAVDGVDREGGDMENELSDSERSISETAERSQRQAKRKREDKLLRTQQAVLEAAQKLVSSETEEECPWVSQGKAWGRRLATMDSGQRIIAMKLISDALYYGESKLLTRAASVQSGCSPQITSTTSLNSPTTGTTTPLHTIPHRCFFAPCFSTCDH